ncbi:MAG: Tetratricopeptide repeat protein, partial [Acidobacteriaceae bacterium]|nr:Tetratricopeptide repeat protein [Acidobacteriaceae bacterium]
FIGLLLACFLVHSSAAIAQTPSSRRAGHTIVILPFENTSKAPGIDWIGEAFAEVLGQRMAAAQLFVIRREDRLYAFDRLGIPANVRPSRATLYRVAEEMDVDYLVTGSYTFDGRTFTTRSQVTDMKRLRMSPDAIESGALTQLMDVQNATAWDLLGNIDPAFLNPKNEFVATASGQIRLDALENYIRGLLATAKDDKVKHFKEAARLNPGYTQAILHLGRTYFDAKEYDQASLWFSKIGKTEPVASEAIFYIGLASYYTGNFERAEEAFDFVAGRVPLIEVFNNLGVVTARRGKKSSLEYFERVVQADSRDPDYRFNLALALQRSGDTNGAVRQLKEALALKPQDTEAKALLETITAAGAQPKGAVAGQKLPLERIKRNYDETSYRQLALEIQNVNEERYAKLPRAEHAAIHVKHSEELIGQGLLDQAEDELREAILLDVSNSGAHAGLAAVLEQRNELSEARFEATAANRLKFSPEAFLTLARIDMKQSKLESARDNVDRALKIDSTNAAGVELKRAIAEQLAQKPKTEGTQ